MLRTKKQPRCFLARAQGSTPAGLFFVQIYLFYTQENENGNYTLGSILSMDAIFNLYMESSMRKIILLLICVFTLPTYASWVECKTAKVNQLTDKYDISIANGEIIVFDFDTMYGRQKHGERRLGIYGEQTDEGYLFEATGADGYTLLLKPSKNGWNADFYVHSSSGMGQVISAKCSHGYHF